MIEIYKANKDTSYIINQDIFHFFAQRTLEDIHLALIDLQAENDRGFIQLSRIFAGEINIYVKNVGDFTIHEDN